MLCLEFEELSQLLERKGIDASDPGRVVDPLEAKKERLLARDEERAKKQTERHVLTEAMSNHPIPRLFVSRRNDLPQRRVVSVAGSSWYLEAFQMQKSLPERSALPVRSRRHDFH